MGKKRVPPAQTSGAAPELPPQGYAELVSQLKDRIRSAQLRAAAKVNRELISLYWQIGQAIVERQSAAGWGKSVVERLARELQVEFPGVGGFSPRNIWRMRAFYLAYTKELPESSRSTADMDGENLPQAVAEIPWGHNIELLEKIDDPIERLWYAHSAVANGWSRASLVHWIDGGLYGRRGKAITNFDRTLTAVRSDLAKETLKSPYNFEFLTLREDAAEAELEQGLLAHIRKFLLELGVGFAFVGQQVHLEVGGEDFYVDLLFYHLKLRCFIVVDLKMTAFKPEYAGKMSFYLSAVDDLMRHPDDGPSIGIVLCKTKNKVIAEYALRDLNKPVGVASYITRLIESLPVKLGGGLADNDE